MKRVYEIIPGFLCWVTLLTPFYLAIFLPHHLAIFVIVFDLYWLYKAFLMGGHLLLGFIYYKRDLEIDWFKRLLDLENLDNFMGKLEKNIAKAKNVCKHKFQEELAEIVLLKQNSSLLKDWRTLYQVVILPTYKEELETLQQSILACQKAAWPKEKMIVVLAIEEREGEPAQEKAAILEKQFKNTFFQFLITKHPKDLQGEMKAKGANVTFAAQKLQKFLDKNKINYEDVIVSTFDADTRAHKQYFACLAYKYVINPDRLHRSFQPIPLYSNNIWHVPALTRIVAFSASFWQIIEATRPYRMINFSSQAMSMQTLIDIHFWDRTIVSEDSRQFFRAYFKYHGDHQVIPIFTPVYMDAVLGRNLWQTLKEQYLQKRRWAWGVEHFPYLCIHLPKHKEIPALSRFLVFWRQFEGHYSWATASLLLAFIGWLPFALNPFFGGTIMAYNLAYLARFIMALTWIGLFISTYVSIGLLPKKPKQFGRFKTAEMYLQWLLVPVTAIFFGSIPAVDAETRMMLGRYLGFWVTSKAYVKQNA